jgi:hypothetical protein
MIASPPATKAGCPIQAIFWLEWDTQHSTRFFCYYGSKPAMMLTICP